jgi:hypothetical protein
MHPRTALISVLLLLVGPLSCGAQDKGYWTAASSTASAITGDLGILKDRVTINLTSFTTVSVRPLTSAEVAAVFDADANAGVAGTLYHLNIPATRRFLHKNTICGSEDTEWMATYASGRNLQVAFFSGANPPLFTFEAVRNSPDLCGTFTYAR